MLGAGCILLRCVRIGSLLNGQAESLFGEMGRHACRPYGKLLRQNGGGAECFVMMFFRESLW